METGERRAGFGFRRFGVNPYGIDGKMRRARV